MAANPAVGIVGASGMVGKFLTNGFLEDGSFAVTLLTRKGGASKLADFEARGAKVVEVDFTDPAALTAALAGLETVMSAVGMEGLQGQVDVIKAAKAAGVKRFVPSEFGMDASSPLVREYFHDLVSAKWSTREALAASGLEYTYVVNTLFLEFMFTPPVHWDVANGSVTLKGKTDTPFTVTSLVDIGRWMPQVLKDPASKNATVYLKGEEVTLEQAVGIISSASGKQLRVTRRSEQELEADIAAAPNTWASMPDVLLKAISNGLAHIPEEKKWNKDAPTNTIAKVFAADADTASSA